MDPGFWHAKWDNNELGFHLGEVNPLLAKHFGALGLSPGDRVFVPLCGKTRDILWLLAAGYRVVGAELSQLAVEQLFGDLELKPVITQSGAVKHYAAADVDIFVGDIFALRRTDIGSIDGVYDRAALVALPGEMRGKYAAHLPELTGQAPQLLITYEYDQRLQEGPPFSVSHAEVRSHYAHCYQLSLIASCDVPGGLKGKCPATEHVWIAKRP